MQLRNKKLLTAWAKENNWPLPNSSLIPIFVTIVTRHKLSLISGEIDDTLDRIFLLADRIDEAVTAGNIVAVALFKERLDEEKVKLTSLRRLLDKEGPVKKEPENGITDEMIQRAKDSPIEELLPEELKRGRCRCPVHGGKNPMSFEVKNNRGRCHSCHWEGDTIQLLIDTRSMSFVQAVRYLQ